LIHIVLGDRSICTIVRAMAKTDRPYVPEQDLLLPPSLRDWLPEGHLAFFVTDLIDQLDLSAITTVYEQGRAGVPAVPPGDDDEAARARVLRRGVRVSATRAIREALSVRCGRT
jgi:hypothetical protein